MNLGVAIGSAVGEYNNQKHMQLVKQEAEGNRALRERQVDMQEADHQERLKARSRETAIKDESAALYKAYQESTPEPGKEASHAAQWTMKLAGVNARLRGMSPKDMQGIAEMVENGRKTEGGQALDRVMQGDSGELGVLAKKMGRNPEGAVLDIRPGHGVAQIVFKDGGKPFDLRQAYAAAATHDQWKAFQENEGQVQKADLHQAQIGNYKAQEKEREGRVTREEELRPLHVAHLKANVRQSNSSANLSDAQAKNVGATQRAAAIDKGDKELLSIIEKRLPPDPDGDGKAKDTAQAAFLYDATRSLMRGGKVNRDQAIEQAQAQLGKVMSDVDSRILALKAAKRKPAEFGASDWGSVRRKSILEKLPSGTSTSNESEE